MAQTIRVETELPTSAERVWSAMQHPTSFLYVCRGLFGWPALAGRTDPIHAGESGSGWLMLFHVLPLYRHSIEVLAVDHGTRTIKSHEHGGMVNRWDHTLHAEEIGPDRCRYSDTVVIEAGAFTALVAAAAKGIYCYRQRRWHRLVERQLLPQGPRYSLRQTAANDSGGLRAKVTAAPRTK